ncbi:MAG: peptidase [Gemmatimonadetes bacterium]|nr:peptidase [Gemmatimonadota bacterium]
MRTMIPPAARRTIAAAGLLSAVILISPLAAGPLLAQRTHARPARSGAAAIRRADLRADVYAMAADSMRGREAGTLDELRAAAWIAERARAAGLEPAGDGGTYFQYFPLRRVRTADAGTVTLGGQPLPLWREAAVVSPVDAELDLPLVFVGQGREADLAGVDLHGKAAAAVVSPPRDVPAPGMSLWAVRYARTAIRERAAFLVAHGAAAVVLVADSVTDGAYGWLASSFSRGSYGVDSANASMRPGAQPPVILLRRAAIDRVRAPAQRLTAALHSESFTYPSVNVVARVRGTSPRLRGEYVLFSGHVDHDGVRAPVDGDSIYNGADDNASVDAGVLAIGRAFARHPERRSALFVWHGAEERGLLGSRWFAAHPTVPRESIAAVLNADMIGRNSPDSAALLGATPPHRNSAALVRMAMAANARTSRFIVDTSWDAVTHPEGWYFRSDHLPYARAGIPALMFTTLLHPDYHTPRDEPQRIDYAKLARVARWMYETGRAVANARVRPAVDPGFKLER